MRKTTTDDLIKTTLYTPTQVTFTTNRLIKIISSRKNDRYYTEILTKKFDISIAPSTDLHTNLKIKTKTKIFETTISEFFVKDKRTTTNGYFHTSYQITPNPVIVKEIPTFIVPVASIPSAILVCIVLSYFVIKCQKIIQN